MHEPYAGPLLCHITAFLLIKGPKLHMGMRGMLLQIGRECFSLKMHDGPCIHAFG